MLPTLRARGARGEADDLAMALGVGIGRYEEAAAAADRRGRPAWADRIRARAALEAGEAIAFLGQKDITDGVDRVVAIFPDGRAFAWNQLNEKYAE